MPRTMGIDSAALPDEIAAIVIKKAELKKYREGEILFAAGDRSDSVYLIRQGRIKMCHFAENGASITLFIHGRGELIGVGGVIDEKERAVYAVIASEDCQLWRVYRQDWIDLMQENAKLSYYTALMLARRIRQLDIQIRRQISIRAKDRLPVVLFDLAIKNGSRGEGGPTKVRITQQELADILGTCRQTTTSMIRNLKEEGIVETEKGYIVIKDLRLLQRKALQVERLEVGGESAAMEYGL